MTTNEAAFLELLAACESLAETTDRCVEAIGLLAQDQRPSPASLSEYRRRGERTAEQLAQFRALIAVFKSQFRTH